MNKATTLGSDRAVPSTAKPDLLYGDGFSREPGLASAAHRPSDGSFLYLHYRIRNGLALGLSDTLALSAAMNLAGLVRYAWIGGSVMIPSWSWYLLAVWWVGASLMRLLPSWGLGPVEELRRLTLLLVSVFAGITVALFLSQQAETASRFTFSLALAISLFLVPWMRLHTKRLLIAIGRWGIPVVIYGAGPIGRRVLALIQQEGGLGYTPVGIFSDDPALPETHLSGVPVLGSTRHAFSRAPVAILAMPYIDNRHLVDLLDGPLARYRTVVIIPDLIDVPSLWVRPRDLNGMLGLEITCNLVSPLARLMKRSLDVGLVVAASPLWVPVFLVTALLLRLENRGPVFYQQERVGKNERLFNIWKFRTMVPNAEAVLNDHLANDDTLREEWNTTYKLKHDPRVTRVGRLLRRYSLDELPQLINVLRGEMSLVGPRPLPAYHYAELAARTRDLRSRSRPGMTGLWQVSGRSDTGPDGIDQWDTYYIRNWSLWLDIVVVIRTVRVVLKGRGAY